MFNKILTTFLIGGAITTVMAGDSDWDMSVGATFRKFKSAEFKSFATEDQYINGSYDGSTVIVDNAGQQVTPHPLAGISPSIPVGSQLASLHSVSFGSSVNDLEDTTGLVLQWTKDIQTSTVNKVGGLDWKFDLSLVWLGVDQAVDGLTDVEGQGFLIDAGDVPQDANDYETVGAPATPGALPASDTVKAFSRYDLDIDAFTFGAGISSRLEMGPLDLKLGVGPSVTLVNYNVAFDGAGGNISESPSELVSVSDDDIVARWGLYGTLGLIYDFNESWGMEVGLRYDYIPDNVNTNVVNLDLSGMSTEVKLIYSF